MKTMDATLSAGKCKLNEGREAEIYDWGNGTVLRLYRSTSAESEAYRQQEILRELTALGVRVPRVDEIVNVEGRPGIVMERLAGPDLLTDLSRRPWRVLQVGGLSGRLHVRLNNTVAPAVLPSLQDFLKQRILGSPEIPDQFGEIALNALSRLPDSDRLCHLDFHPANILTNDGESVVIDWSIACRGAPEADFAQTQLIISLGEPPPGAPPHLKFLALVGRRLLLGAYRRAYRRAAQVDENLLSQWHLPLAVCRLAAGIREERPRLIKHVENLIRG